MTKAFVPGSADWVEAFRRGALNRPPVPETPLPRRKPLDGFIVFSTLPLAPWHGKDCPYCLREMLIGTARKPTRDHVYPRRLGGRLSNDNKLIVCAPCNNDKADLTLEQWAYRLFTAADPRAEIVWRWSRSTTTDRHPPS